MYFYVLHFLVLQFQVLQFHALHIGPPFSCPAISCPANALQIGPSFSCPAISWPTYWSVNFMCCIFMSCNFDGPSFSCPSFSVNPSEAWLSELGYLTLKFVVNVGEHQTEMNGMARFPCDSTAFLFFECMPNHAVPNIHLSPGFILHLPHTGLCKSIDSTSHVVDPRHCDAVNDVILRRRCSARPGSRMIFSMADPRHDVLILPRT